MSKKIYLDYAAATSLDISVQEKMVKYYTEKFHNPSSIYLAANSVRSDIEEARAELAKLIGANASEVVYTAGGTESVNLAISGLMSMYPDCKVLHSSIEHAAVVESARAFNSSKVPVKADGIIDLKKLKSRIDDDTVMVSIIHANNEIGVVQPISKIASLISAVRSERSKSGNKLPIYLHSDACQSPNYLDIHVDQLGVDLMSLNGSKVYGPKQSGVLYVRRGLELEPLIKGGGQELGLRSGTENPANIVGISWAMRLAQSLKTDETKRLSQLRDSFFKEIQSIDKEVMINGSLKHRLANNINVSFDKIDGERLVMMLDEAGFECATGSACSAKSDEPSHVLSAIGLNHEQANGSLRISLGRQTTSDDLDKLLVVLKKILPKARQLSSF